MRDSDDAIEDGAEADSLAAAAQAARRDSQRLASARVAAEASSAAAKASRTSLGLLAAGLATGWMYRPIDVTENAEDKFTFMLVPVLLLLAGAVAGLAAVRAALQHPQRKALRTAWLWTSLNAVFLTVSIAALVLAARAFSTTRDSPAKAAGPGRPSAVAPAAGPAAPEPSTAEVEAYGRDAARNYPGWIGLAEVGRATLAVSDVAPSSEFGKYIASQLNAPARIAILYVDNSRGSRDRSFAPESAAFETRTGGSVRAIATSTLSPGDPTEREAFDENFAVIRDVPAKSAGEAVLFFPPTFDPREAVAFTIDVDGKSVRFEGQWYSLKEKRAYLGIDAEEEPTTKPTE